MRRALLIHNPAAGRAAFSDQLAALVRELAAGGFAVDARATAAPGHATELAAEAAARGDDAVFALGGNGTLREAATGLLGSSVPLGALPGGTANVLALALGIPRRAFAAAHQLAHGVCAEMDVGLCGERPFLMMASAGLDATTLRNLPLERKRRFGRAGILLQGLTELSRYPGGPPLAVEAAARVHLAHFAAFCNIPLYGGPLAMAPTARLDDGLLDLVLFRGSSRRALLSFLLDLATGTHLQRRDVTHLRTREVSFLGPDSASLQLDGDPCPATLPVALRISEHRLRVLVPRGSPLDRSSTIPQTSWPGPRSTT